MIDREQRRRTPGPTRPVRTALLWAAVAVGVVLAAACFVGYRHVVSVRTAERQAREAAARDLEATRASPEDIARVLDEVMVPLGSTGTTDPELTSWFESRDRALRYLRVAHRQSVPMLIAFVGSNDRARQIVALEVLSRVRDPQIMAGMGEPDLSKFDDGALSLMTDVCEINGHEARAQAHLQRIVELHRGDMSERAQWVLDHPGMPSIDEFGVWRSTTAPTLEIIHHGR